MQKELQIRLHAGRFSGMAKTRFRVNTQTETARNGHHTKG